MGRFIYIFICLFITSCQINQKKSVIFQENVKKIEDNNGIKGETAFASKDSIVPTLNDLRLNIFKDIPIIELPLSSQKLDTLFFNDEGEYILKRSVKENQIDSTLIGFKKYTDYEDYANAYFYHFFYNGSRQFHPIYKIIKKNYTVIGCLTFFYASDITGLQFELHSFDQNGEQIDFLVVYLRYFFEVYYKNDFNIDKNFHISISKKMTEYFEGDIDSELESPKITKKVENYFFNEKGIFQKIESIK